MVRVWMLDETTEGQGKPVHFDELRSIGVLYWKLDADTYETNEEYHNIKKARGYNYQEIVEVSPTTLANYDEKVKDFAIEHVHGVEEVLLVLDGSGYFDVRDRNDKWVRIATTKGDMIMLPPGIYHRFELDSNKYIKVQPLFAGDPVRIQYNRPEADDNEHRRAYVRKFLDRSG